MLSASLNKTFLSLYSQKHTGDTRLGVVFNPSSVGGENRVSKAVKAALDVLTGNNARNFITKLVKEEVVAELQAGGKTMEDLAVHVNSFHGFNIM